MTTETKLKATTEDTLTLKSGEWYWKLDPDIKGVKDVASATKFTVTPGSGLSTISTGGKALSQLDKKLTTTGGNELRINTTTGAAEEKEDPTKTLEISINDTGVFNVGTVDTGFTKITSIVSSSSNETPDTADIMIGSSKHLLSSGQYWKVDATGHIGLTSNKNDATVFDLSGTKSDLTINQTGGITVGIEDTKLKTSALSRKFNIISDVETKVTQDGEPYNLAYVTPMLKIQENSVTTGKVGIKSEPSVVTTTTPSTESGAIDCKTKCDLLEDSVLFKDQTNCKKDCSDTTKAAAIEACSTAECVKKEATSVGSGRITIWLLLGAGIFMLIGLLIVVLMSGKKKPVKKSSMSMKDSLIMASLLK